MVTTNYLIVDTNALIKLGKYLESMAENLITTPEVLAEWKTKDVEINLQLHVPSSTYLTKVKELAKESGDWSTISQQDWTLCALALEFTEKYSRKAQRTLVERLTEEEKSSFSPEELARKRVNIKPITVECITNDFAMQNILKILDVKVQHTSGMGITRIKKTMLRCYSCFKLEKDSDKQFCENCGHPTLTRVTVTEENNGELKVHLRDDWRWNNKGSIHPIGSGPAFKITGNTKNHRAHPHSKTFLETYKNYIARSADDPIYIKQKSNYEKANQKITSREDFFLDENYDDKFLFMNRPSVQPKREVNQSQRKIHKNKRR
eukprot:NODE_290_length_10614_cov_1.553590.p3 type:complete len:320 gc:universal NODE_290_length_10614_cov_1.553590:5759-4800(-)